MTGYLKALKKNENVYLSPEGLQNLGAKILEPTFDYSLNDVFSVGITMLECMSLRPGYSFYNFQ